MKSLSIEKDMAAWSTVQCIERAELEKLPEGPAERLAAAASNTEATQVRALAKINTPITRTRRHSPAHGGTTAKMSM
jgi:hypothetical protein